MIDGVYTSLFIYFFFGRMAGPHAKFVLIVFNCLCYRPLALIVSGVALSYSFSPA